MASTKEAMAIIVDVGPSMNQGPPGLSTALETSLEAVKMIIQRKMFSESKDEIALILFGTPTTANDLANGEAYENVSVARPLGPVDWELLNFVQNEIHASDTSGDFLDALVVAMDHLVRSTEGKKGFVSKRVILFSDVGGEFGDDQLDDIIGGIKERGIEFNVIGPNLEEDDEDSDDERPSTANGHVKEKTPQQRAGEALLKHIIEHVNGESYSFSEALPALSFFQARATRPTAWKAHLKIGDDLEIPVNGYIRIKEAKAKNFSQVYAKDPDAGIERATTFHLNDEEETEIEKSDTAEGHRYGNTLVPFSSDDKDAMKYHTEKCLTVLGFTSRDKVKRHCVIGENSMTFIPEKGDEAAAVALSAFIKALYETNMVAIVRKVYQKNAAVKLGCLVPHIKLTYECLFYTELPFSEDIRQFTFSTLPLSQDGGESSKNSPSEKQLEAMDELITAMDLTQTGGDDGEPEEALKPKLTFNPYLQRLYQCLQHRADNPHDPLPELSPVIAEYLKPPQEIETRCEPVLDKMKNLFKLERAAIKKEEKTGENMFKDEEAGPSSAKKAKKEDDLEGGMADLTKAKVTEVGTVTPVEDFKTMVGQKDEDIFEEACKMMQKRILQLVTDSFGSQFYEKASDCLQALREECIKNGEPKIFNDYLKELKDSLPEGHKKFWDHIVEEKISLISKVECEQSKVSKDEASQFLAEAEVKKEAAPSEPTQEAEDLFDELE